MVILSPHSLEVIDSELETLLNEIHPALLLHRTMLWLRILKIFKLTKLHRFCQFPNLVICLNSHVFRGQNYFNTKLHFCRSLTKTFQSGSRLYYDVMLHGRTRCMTISTCSATVQQRKTRTEPKKNKMLSVSSFSTMKNHSQQ